MATEIGTVYQSGETVLISGNYELAGGTTSHGAEHGAEQNTQTVRRELKKGDKFPNYDGFAVGWYIARNAVNGNDSDSTGKADTRKY